jgi:hypothetical protein
MPNRILKESISKSEKLNGLTDFQFRLWIHLITYVDDYGRGDARPAIIKGSCFPFRERLTSKDIEKGLADLAGAGCVCLYKVDGKPYLYFPNWEEHQRVRTKVSKCPAPEEKDILPQIAADCGEMPQNAARIQNTESRIRIQNPNTESEGVRVSVEEGFELFWKAYPKKENRKKALEAFKKVSVPVETLLEAIEAQKKTDQWRKNNGQFIPHPTTWLNGCRWEDQIAANYDHVPKGASGNLGQAELEAIERMMREEL